jgi:hypothetical protein
MRESRTQPNFFFFSNQLESSVKKSKSKNVLQTIFPGEKRRASTCRVESWREFKNTFRRRPSFFFSIDFLSTDLKLKKGK